MTYEEFQRVQMENAFNAMLTDNNYKRSFIDRLSNPKHQIQEWEEEIVNRLMALSSSQAKDVSLSR